MQKILKFNPLARLFAAAALFVASIGASAGMAFAVATVNVDNSPGCSPAGPTYCTIQQGVDAASSGDTVKVAKGTSTYADPVNVNKSLTLLGSQAVVNAGGTNGVTLNANNITVRGFAFTGNTTGPAVTTSKDFSSYTVTKNTFSGNVFGLYLNSNGVIASNVNHNTFDGNNLAGAASGNGIYADQGLKKAEVDHNVFKNQNNSAMAFLSTANAVVNDNLKVDHNTFNGPGAFILLVNGHNDSFDHNQGSGTSGNSAVVLGGSDSNIDIDHNSLTGSVTGTTKNGFSGVRINVDQAGFGSGTLTLVANDNVTVDHNSIRNFGDGGVLVGTVGSSPSTLTNSTIDHNSIFNNGDTDEDYDSGIYIRAGNTGLNINRNTMHNNLKFDARDNNAPGANTWTSNSCGTSSPSGLCS